ncbi:MAG TPA: FAD-binding oxidoreductase [Candidatus Binatia bacterium]|jgi:glycine/D-amino acid oxidase-like deaminating enzyme
MAGDPIHEDTQGRDARVPATIVSPWMAAAHETAAPLQGDFTADVVIVGGGYTGLSSALAFRGEGRRVVLLEGNTCGFGASGRNAGHLTATIGKDVPTLLKLFGRERTSFFVSLADTAIAEVERLMREHCIECEYEPVGNVVAATHPKQYRNIDRLAEAARVLGLPGTLLEPEEMLRRGLPRSFVRGFHESHGGILHPGLYVRGLRRAALEAGVEIHERSPVIAIDDDSRPRVRTREGTARGDLLVLAVNAYGLSLELPRAITSRLLPVYVQLLATAPLTSQQLARIGWQGREGIYTAHEALESWRLTRDNRIVGGSKHVRYGYGGKLLPDRDARIQLKLEAVLRCRFPELAEIEVTSAWGGRIGIALDFLPVVGRTGRSGRILYSMSYAGHGIAMASYAGRMLADLEAGRDGPGSVLWKRRTLALPPEPLRWLVFHLLNGFFEAVDRRVDRSLT